ncbi:MAG: hypothetical protein MPK62_01680 [Alphaproteobacteria bacterium]|nr:hypothetical protein [Alphaproteobacteria bacterium]MDA8029843.1 hypothetical protein [Alphaproteobacteria bacterium]
MGSKKEPEEGPAMIWEDILEQLEKHEREISNIRLAITKNRGHLEFRVNDIEKKKADTPATDCTGLESGISMLEIRINTLVEQIALDNARIDRQIRLIEGRLTRAETDARRRGMD